MNSTQGRHYIFANELLLDLNNHLCLLLILEKLKVVPYYDFYGSLYVNALDWPINQEQALEGRQYASQVYFNVILRYIPRNRIHCV